MADQQLPAGVKEVERIAAPGGGWYVLGDDGGVFTLADASGKAPVFYGSAYDPNSKSKYAAGSLRLNPTGGYYVRDTEGREQNFDTAYARSRGATVPDAASTLNADPAMLAFLRTSGLSLETAANQVRQQTATLNAARDTAIGDSEYSAENQKRSTAGGYESRGVLRSSTHQQAQDRVERERLARRTQIEGNTANQISGLNQGLVSKVLDQQNKAAELGLSIGQRQDYDETVNQIKRKYQPELAAGGLTI